MTVLAGGVDELEGDVLGSTSVRLGEETLSEGEDSLLDSRARTLDHDKVVGDASVSDESSNRGDGLLGGIVVGGGIVSSRLTDSVDLVVD